MAPKKRLKLPSDSTPVFSPGIWEVLRMKGQSFEHVLNTGKGILNCSLFSLYVSSVEGSSGTLKLYIGKWSLDQGWPLESILLVVAKSQSLLLFASL